MILAVWTGEQVNLIEIRRGVHNPFVRDLQVPILRETSSRTLMA